MIRWTVTAYCSECGYDLAEADDDSIDVLSEDMQTRAHLIHAEHVKYYPKCLSSE